MAEVCAGILCCEADYMVKFGPGPIELAPSYPCAVSYGVFGLFYPEMMLGGTLLDDEEVWASLDSVQLAIFSG